MLAFAFLGTLGWEDVSKEVLRYIAVGYDPKVVLEHQ